MRRSISAAPLGQDHLLLVAAREGARPLFRTGRLDEEPAERILDQPHLLFAADIARSRHADPAGMCHRILVMRDGEIIGEFNREDATQEKLVGLCMGGKTV